MPDPTVSVIITAYNSARFIQSALASVLVQDFADFEVIVVNDGSTDNTAELVRAIPDPRVRLVSKANAGLPAARNSGLDAAHGKYIAFLDHDDYWHPNKLSAQVELLESDSSIGVVYGEFSSWDGMTDPAFPDPLLRPSEIDPTLSGWMYHQLLLTNWVLITTAMFRRSAMEQVGRFNVDRPYADDWDYAIRMSRRYQFRKLRQVVALYRVHPGQSSKQVMRINPADELRSRTIAQYGYRGPDGSEVDHRKLRQRISRDRLNFGLRHYDVGSWDIAARSFAGAIRAGPLNVRAVTFLLASILKWATAPKGMVRSK